MYPLFLISLLLFQVFPLPLQLTSTADHTSHLSCVYHVQINIQNISSRLLIMEYHQQIIKKKRWKSFFILHHLLLPLAKSGFLPSIEYLQVLCPV